MYGSHAFFNFLTRFFPNHYRPRSVCLRCLDGLFYLLYYGILLPKKVHFLFYFFTSLIFSVIQTFKEKIFLHKTARSCVCLADRPLLLPSIVGGEAPTEKNIFHSYFFVFYKSWPVWAKVLPVHNTSTMRLPMLFALCFLALASASQAEDSSEANGDRLPHSRRKRCVNLVLF